MSVWERLDKSAWKSATDNEKVFLSFCMAFREVSGDETKSESEYWDAALAAETSIRSYLLANEFWIKKQEDFDLSLIADGMLAGRVIRTLQAHYGISLCGRAFQSHSPAENERKYQKAIRVAERMAMLGCSSKDNLPYFKAADHMAA